MATNSSTNGWSVSYISASNSLSITVPNSASVGNNYKAKYFNTSQYPVVPRSATFNVTSGQSNNPPDPPTLFATAGHNFVSLNWTLSTGATSYTIKRSLTPTGTPTVLQAGIAGLSHLDMTAQNGTTYYYTVTSFNLFGESGPSNQVAATPTSTFARFEVTKLVEKRTQGLTLSVKVSDAQPTSSSISTVYQGVTYYGTSSTEYFLGYATSGQGVLQLPQGRTWRAFSLQSQPSQQTEQIQAYKILSSQETATITFTTTGGAVKLFLIRCTGGSYHNAPPEIQPMPSETVVQQENYNLSKRALDAVSVGSRRTYGQPNLEGELPADANAPLRNPSYASWVYKGGLFAGNAPQSSGDLSGTTRIQLYLTSTAGFVEPIHSTVALLHLGHGGNFSQSPNLSLSKPSTTDPNLSVTLASAVWENRWDLAQAEKLDQLLIDSTVPAGEYACFQAKGLHQKVIVHLKDEQLLIDSGQAYWRYFANVPYAQASGLLTVDEAQPRIWVVDRQLRWGLWL